MKTNLQKFFAWLLVLTMAVGMLPMTALADSQTSSEYTPMESADEGSTTTLDSAFDAVQKAIDSNATAAAPYVSISANATQEPIKTGEVFKYNISYTLNPGPNYTLRSGDVVSAYSRYKNVKISITPGDDNITLYNDDGEELPRTHVITIAEANPGNPSFNINARMTNNGTAPNGTIYEALKVTMSVEMEVTDQNLGETRTMKFATENVKVDTTRSKVKNTAENNWWVEKEAVGDPEPDGNGHVTFTYRIKAGKHVGAMTSDEENDYNVTGTINFKENKYTLTDTLPTPMGMDGTAILPVSSTLTVVTPSTREAVAGTTTVRGGNGTTKLSTTYYNTTTTTGNAREAGDTPMYTEYLVTATYPVDNLRLPFGSVGDAQVAFENKATLSYTLEGSTKPTEMSDTAQLAYSERTMPGYIRVKEFLWLPSGSTKKVEFDAFYYSVFPSPAVFEIYRAEDFDEATVGPKAGKTSVLPKPLEITNTYNQQQTDTQGLEPGDYIVVQTARPKDSLELVDDNGYAKGKEWARVTVNSGETTVVDFINRVEGFGILSIKKVLVEGAQEIPLKGITFTLTSKTDSNKKYTFTTDATGVGVVKATAGNYTLTEQVQAGYMEDPDYVNMEVEVKNGDHLDMRGTPIKNYKNAAKIAISKYAIMQTNEQKQLIHTVSGVGAEGVKNFLFKLERATGANNSTTQPADTEWSTVQGYESFTLGEGSELVIDNMPRVDADGNYYWYRLSEDKCNDPSFTKDERHYTWRFDNEQGDSIACEFYNLLKGTFKFKKEVLTQDNKLGNPQGYEFEICTKVDGELKRQGELLTSIADGTFQTQLLPVYDEQGNKIEYYLREVATPENMDMVVSYEDPVDVETNSYGPITLDDWAKVTDHTDKAILNRENKGSITITKQSSTSASTKLKDVVFEVYQINNATDEQTGEETSTQTRAYILDDKGEHKQFTTGINGKVTISSLPLGTYYLEEVVVPEGYLAPEQDVEVLLDAPYKETKVTVKNTPKPSFTISKTMQRWGLNDNLELTGDFEFVLYQNVGTEEEPDMQPVLGEDNQPITIQLSGSGKTYVSAKVFVETAGDYYLFETKRPENALPSICSATEGIDIDVDGDGKADERYYGPSTLENGKNTVINIQNRLNFGIIHFKKLNEKTKWEWGLWGAKIAISATVSKDSYAATRLSDGVSVTLNSARIDKPTATDNGDTVTYTFTISSKDGTGPMYLMGIPVYDGAKPIKYALEEISPPEGYLLPDDNAPHYVTPARHEYYTVKQDHKVEGDDSTLFYDPPEATITAKKVYESKWEIHKGHSIKYPLEGALLGLYRVDSVELVDEAAGENALKTTQKELTFIELGATDENGYVTFGQTNKLNGMKTYVVVELKAPDGYEMPQAGMHEFSDPTALNGITLDELKNEQSSYYANVSDEINLKGVASNAYTMTNENALLNYEPYVQLRLIKYEDINGNNKADVTGDTPEDALLNRAQFKLYSCSVEDYKNKISGKQLTNERLKELLTVEDYVYETGTEKNRNGSFLTQVQKSGRVYWFEESREPAGYKRINDLIGPIVPQGMTGRDTYTTGGITTIEVANEKGDDDEDELTLRYFQVELNKILVDEDGKNPKYLANTTFELYLTKVDGSGRIPLTKFTTGLDEDGEATSPGRGISISFEFTNLLSSYGSDYITVIPQTGANGDAEYHNYSANFVLVEVDYPSDTTPEKLEYPFTITTNATSAALSEMLYDYFTGENSIVNIHTTKVPVRIRKMGYVVGSGKPTEATATPLEGVQIGIYRDEDCTDEYAIALTDEFGFANFTVEPSTNYWFKELTTIAGYELDSTPVDITSPNYREQQKGYSVIYNKALRKVRLLKLNENGQPLANVQLQVVQGADTVTGRPVVLPDGSQLSPDTFTTHDDGYTDYIELPAGIYRVIEAGVNRYQKNYFNMLNTTGGRLYPTFTVGDEPEVEFRFKNPGRGSLTLTKVDDSTDHKPISGISFKVTYKQFSANDLATNAQTTTTIGFGTDYLGENGWATWTTNANGQIERTGLIPGWYCLREMVETVPEEYVALSEPVIIKVTGKLLGADETTDTAVTVTNVRKGHLVIEKTFAQSDVISLPATASFDIYSDEACTMQVGDTQVITIDETSRTGKTEPSIMLNPGEYYIKEVTDVNNWHARYSVNGVDAGWVTDVAPMKVIVTSNNTTELPITLSVTNIPAYAKVDIDKVDDNENPAPVVGATFGIHYVSGATNLYYQEDGTWALTTTNRKVWTTDENGRISMEVRLPDGRVLAGDENTTAEYFIEELTAPAQYVIAPLTTVQLGVGTTVQLTGENAIVDETGMSITLTKYGKTYENATAQDVLPGARIALYKVTGSSAQFLSDADTNESGNVTFANLPKLSGEDEYYAIAETITPATHMSGTITVYVDGEAVEGVTIGDNMLFNVAKDEDTTVNAYNTPKGRLAILKYNYLKPTIAEDVPRLAEFKIERMTDEGTYADYVPVLYTNTFGEAPLYPDELTWDGGSIAKDSASGLYIGASEAYNGYYFTSYFTDFVVEPGTYRITETASPNLFFHTPDSEPGDPWYPVREVTVGDNGETVVCCIANIPNPEAQDISISKTVALVNGAAPTELAGLQGDDWQTITYNIADFTKSSDGQTAIQLRLNLLELRDFEVDFKSAAGATVNGHHYVEEVVVGKADYLYTPIGGTGSSATIYATVYGYRPNESPDRSTGAIVATVDISATRTVQFPENTYAGFSVMYGTDAKGVLKGLDYGFTADPVQVTMRVRQDSNPEVVPATSIINTARARMTYDIGSVEDVSTSWYTASANSITQEEAAVPRVTIEKTAVKINDAGEPMTVDEGGDFSAVQPGQRLRYYITVRNISTDENAVLKDPVIIDLMPKLVDFTISNVRVETSAGSTITAGPATQVETSAGSTIAADPDTQNVRYIYSKLTGELKPREYAYMTIDCTVKYSTVTNPSGVVDNTAYVISLYELPMNVDNPTGVSFLDENGNLPAHDVTGNSISGSADKLYKGLRATTQHTLSQTSMLQLVKMVSAEQSGDGIGDFIGQDSYAVSLVDGEIRYKIFLVNGGDTEITNIRIMDKLPIAGDTQIGMPISRNSAWRTRFDGLVSVTIDRSGYDPRDVGSDHYTLWSTTTAESGSSYVDVLKGLSTEGWSTGANADSLAIMLAFDDTVLLDPGEMITVEFKAKAPSEEEAQDAYFRMAVNNAYSTYDVVNSTGEPGLINSPDTRVTLMPGMVSLGNRVWVDKNANGIQDYADGEDYDSPSATVALEHALRESGMSIQLHTFINNESSSSTLSVPVENGFYAFTDLSPAAIIPDEVGVAYESNGDIKNSSLLGTARTTYQLELLNIPDGYLVTKPYQLSGGTVPNYEGDTGDARAKDSNFSLRDGSYKSEKFYLKADVANDTTFDVGLMRIRDLEVEKKGTDDRNINGVTFAIYGPYTSEELYGVQRSGLVITADKLVDTIATGSDGKAKFTSTASKFLNYYSNYVVVETSSADNYAADQLVATGEGIGAPDEYPAMSGEGIISGKNYFVLKQESSATKVQAVKATNEYKAEGGLLLSGTKTFTGGDIANTQFEFELTSTGDYRDPDFAGLTATSDTTGAFVFENIVYDFADVGTYVYTMKEKITDVTGVQYDTNEYTITVDITDNGDGTLAVNPTITDTAGNGNSVTNITFENKGTGSVTVTKVTAGNGKIAGDAFSFTVKLTDASGANLMGDVAYMYSDQEATTATLNANGELTFSLVDGQSFTALDLPTGTQYEITEDNYTAQGYTTAVTVAQGGSVDAGNTRKVTGAITQGTVHTFTYRNTREVGDITIYKVLAGNDTRTDHAFEITLSLSNTSLPLASSYTVETKNASGTTQETVTVTDTTADGQPAMSAGTMTFALHGGDYVNVKGLPVGTSYSVTENTHEGSVYALNEYTGSVIAYSDDDANRAINRETNSVIVTNTKNAFGRLTVSKMVGGNAADEDKQFNFTLTLTPVQGFALADSYQGTRKTGDNAGQSVTLAVTPSGRADGSGTLQFSLAHNQSMSIAGILAGTGYAVAEGDYRSEGYVTTATTPTQGAVAQAGNAVAFLNVRNVGDLTLSKTLEGNATDPNMDFTFTVHLSRADGASVSGEYAYEVDGVNTGTVSVNASGNTQLTLRGGQTATIRGIPVGTTYTVTEAQANQNGYVTTQTGDSGTISTDGSAAAFTNTRNTGTLTVRKTLTGNATEATRAFNFTVVINDPNGVGYNGTLATTGGRTSLMFTNGRAQFTLTGGQSLTIQGLLAGSIYSVTETDANQNGYTTTMTGATGVIRNDAEAVASFVNSRSVTQAYTSLSATKTWDDGNNADGLRPTSITVYLYRNNQAVDSRVMTEAAGWTASFNNLPVYDDVGDRYAYRVVEVATAEYYATYNVEGTVTYITNSHNFERFTVLEDAMVPLGGNINMNEGDCFN